MRLANVSRSHVGYAEPTSASTSPTLSVEEGTRVQDKPDAGAQVALRLVGCVSVAVLPKQVHLSGIELYKPKRGANGRCLAGAVCAHKANDLAGLHGKRDVVEEKRSLTRRDTPLSSSKYCMV